MKIKGVQFTSTNDKQRHLQPFGGYMTAIFVGQQVRNLKRQEFAEIASIELDRQAKLLLVRMVYADGKDKGKPFRTQTTNETIKPWEVADGVAIAYDERTVIYFDDEAAPAQQKSR
jgi:hypothetical protein